MSIEQTVRQFVLENFLFTDDPAAIGDSDSFLDAGIMDSTGVFELIMFLEKQFSIKIEEKEMIQENLDSVDNIARYVKTKQTMVV